MHVIRHFISILSDFVTSHKITFYSKLYDIDLLENCTHDRTYITLYVHEFVLSLHQHCFLDKKAPRTTLNHRLTKACNLGIRAPCGGDMMNIFSFFFLKINISGTIHKEYLVYKLLTLLCLF